MAQRFKRVPFGLPHLIGHDQQAGIVAGLQGKMERPRFGAAQCLLLGRGLQPKGDPAAFVARQVQIAPPGFVAAVEINQLNGGAGEGWIGAGEGPQIAGFAGGTFSPGRPEYSKC